jgi:hypothetical protein
MKASSGFYTFFLTFAAAYIVVEAYNAGLREARPESKSDIPVSDDDTDAKTDSQPDGEGD